MTKVKQRIEQLTKRHAALADSITALSVEYSEGEQAHETKLKEAKAITKSGRLSESEEKYYKQLSVGLKTENPLGVLLRLFLIEQVENPTGYMILGSDRETWYVVDEQISICTCPRFSAKHNCVHLDAVRLLTRLKYGSSVAATFGVGKG